MKTLCALTVGLVVAAGLPALAGDSHPLTYAVFEASVPHLDMENCPPALAAPEVFCRLTMAEDELHVFAFSHEGEQQLVGFKSFGQDEFEIVLK